MSMRSRRAWLTRVFRSAGRAERAAGVRAFRGALCEGLEARTLLATFTVSNLNDAGAGSLRQAVLSANAAVGADTIEFQAGLNGTIGLTSGQIEISGALTVNGPGASLLTVSGNNTSRVFTVSGGPTTINGLGIASGRSSYGGGIWNTAPLTLNRVVLNGNTSTGPGGGVAADAALTVTESTISGNTANETGGITAQTLTISRSLFTGNSSASGGAAITFGTALTLDNSTLTGNTTSNAVIACFGTATIRNSTIAGNTTAVGFQINPAFPATLVSSIIAGHGTEIFGTLAAGSTNNLIQGASTAGGLTNGVNGNLVGINPQLGALADNGGATRTMALPAGSPAIGVGLNPNGLTTDQRGGFFGRGTAVDIGAYQRQSLNVAVDTLVDENDGNIAAGDISLREALAAAGANPGSDTITFAASLNGGTITLGGTELSVTGNVTITGPGANLLTVSGNNVSRVFNFVSGTSLLIGLTVTGGRTSGGGGGILNAGSLTIQNAIVTANTATTGGGAGITNSGTLSISDSRIAGNTATGGAFAGGIFNIGGSTLTIERTEISGNNGNGFSGAIDARGTVTIRNSTITGNTATDTGGLLIGGDGPATVTILNSTIANNTSTTVGGIDLRNSASQVVLSSTIVAGNTRNSAPNDISGTLATGSTHNLIGDPGSAGGLTGGVNNNLVGGNVFLGTLSGSGIARFIPILPGSFAIGAGTANGLTTDQRGAGFPRATNGLVDVGAFQFQETTILVDLATDENDGNFAAGDMSLREAVLRAAALVRVRITFAWGTTPTAVAVNAGPIQVNFAENVSIDGVGATTIAGNNSSRIFRVNGGGSLALTGVTVTGGTTGSGSAGGAILNEPGGTLSLTRATITGNTATNDSGGGIANRGTFTMIDSTISNNTATFGGGGLHNTGTATITRSTFSGNTANNQGGPGGGGGIANTSGGAITIIGSTLANNTSSFGFGGGLFTDGAGAASISNSTIAGNVATGSFGFALSRNGSGTLVLISSIVSASQLVINGAMSAGSTNNIVFGGNTPNTLGQLTNGVNGNIVGVNPLIGPLANNGGLTQTMALLAGSPAIDAGVNPSTLAADQRGAGFPRQRNGGVDIGAFESGPTGNAFVVSVLADEDNGDRRTADLSLREAILEAGLTTGPDTITFATSVRGTITLGGTELSVNSDMTITGPGANLLTISGNNASRVFNFVSGNSSLSGLTVSGGSSFGSGGGIFNSGTLTISNTAISGNFALGFGPGSGAGGGVSNTGTLTILSSTISANQVAAGMSGPGGGSGVLNSGTLTITNSTVAGNLSGGIASSSAATVQNSTIAGNTGTGIAVLSGTLVLVSSIVAGSVAADVTGTLAAGSTNNLIQNAASAGGLTNGVNGNIVGVNPLLGALASNGGATQTMALLAGSPAINAGVNPSTLSTDHRGTGFARVVGSAIDIGAYEHVPPAVAPTLVSLTASAGSVAAGNTVTLTANGAADTDATIARVDFYLDANTNGVADAGELFSTDTNGADGYTAVYGATQGQATTAGARAFLAIAVDSQSLSSPTRGVSVTWTAQAASAVVTVATDESNGNLNANDLSLREVLQLLNAGAVQGPVTFASGVTQITLASALPTISRAVTITGPGAALLTISGANQFQIFSVNDGLPAAAAVTISGLTLTQGSAAAGGAISNFESLTVDGVVFLNNAAVNAGMGMGGAIDDNGTLTVRNSRFSGNASDGFGSAINFAVGAGAGNISGSAFLGNSTPMGSTIDSPSGHTLTIDTSTFANNTAAVGGGVFMGSVLTVRQSTFFANTASSFGGAIAMYGGTLVVQNSTIVGNRALATGTGPGQGGGIEVGKNPDIPGDPGTLQLVSTILSGNVRGAGVGTPDELAFSRGATVTANSTNNLIRHAGSAGGLTNGVNANIIGVDPLLATTLTTEGTALGGVLALLAGSPAINAGLNPQTLATDQRGAGFTRVIGSAIDIGAYEAPASVPGSGGTPTGQTGPTQYQARSTAIEQVDASAAGLTVVTTTNNAGQPVVFRQNAQGQWVVTNVGSRLNVATLSGDPTPFVGPDGRNYAMARSGSSMLLFTESGGTWTVRNLTTELSVPAALAPTDLTSFTDTARNRYLAGRADNGNIVMFVGTRSGNNYNWTFANLSDQLTAQRLVTPAFTSRLVSYTTSWNGLNIAGLDAQGVIHTVWWAPSLTRWTTSNLSAITGAPAYTGQLTTYVTSYDATNLVGTSADGQVIATWWLPGIQWRADNLTTMFNGPRMTAASVSSYVTGWDGTNIAGIDSNGQIQVYWWAPGMNTWQIFNMTTGIANATPMVGSVRGFTSTPGILNVVGAAANGDVLRYSVNPFAPNAVWGQENLTSIATPG